MIQALTVFAVICGVWMAVCWIMEWLDMAEGHR